MSPKKLSARTGDTSQARSRRRIAAKHLEVADLIASEDGTAINVCVGLAVLAGIAAGDAVCLAATGERYAGVDHAAAAELLRRVDARLGARLSTLVGLKPGSHYGHALLDAKDRAATLRAAHTLVDAATERTT
ncbi:MAG: hypothetical protein WAL50_22355 [Kineosporiaceae bacterium]